MAITISTIMTKILESTPKFNYDATNGAYHFLGVKIVTFF
jgi:hypothetical protein